jgi:hypothetical protein
MAGFDADTLGTLRGLAEVAIRTGRHPASAVVIWVAVADEDGHATLEFSGRKVPVQAMPTHDTAAVDRVSGEYLRKYRTSPYAEAMVRPEALSTTLRLEPR